MLETIRSIFKVEDLRRRILFTLAMLVILRIGVHIAVPNTNPGALQSIMNGSTGSFLGLANSFAGNALEKFGIFALGIMPYIIASMIVQLLSMDIVPAFGRWAKEGEVGRRKMSQMTRYFTIALALVQSTFMSIAFNRMSEGGESFVTDSSLWSYALIAITLTAGTAFLMWMGEQITEKGIGNGISIIIFANIVAGIPSGLYKLYEIWFVKESQVFLSVLKALALLLIVVLVVVGVIYMQQGVRKVTVQYTKRVVGNKMYGGQATHIPFKINSAGVIPVIFAVSLIMFPSMVASWWKGNVVADWIINTMSLNHVGVGTLLYVLMIIGFTYFYTFVQLNPMQLSDQMKKNGGFIPGIRPGKNTTAYLTKILTRLTATGALFLAFIAVMPMFFSNLAGLPQQITIGGTSLLIVIGVALETMKTVESQLIKRHYKGFMSK